MTAKIFCKSIVIILALLLIVSLAACGEQKTDETAAASTDAASAPAEIKAADATEAQTATEAAQATEAPADANAETFGNIVLVVPEGMIADEDDGNDDLVTLINDSNDLEYYIVTIVDTEDEATGGVDTTREINGGEDVNLDAGAKWTGVTYTSFGFTVYHVYAPVGDRFAVVQCCGHTPESDESVAFLSSIKLA